MNIRKLASTSLIALAATLGAGSPVQAQAIDPLLGQLQLFGNTYCPRGWTEVAGQTLPISSNQALFALLGTTYGGNGQTTFQLPDLRGRAPIHSGTLPGGSNYQLGQQGGVESVSLLATQIAAHTHDGTLRAAPVAADTTNPVGNYLGIAGQSTLPYTASTTAPANNMGPNSLQIDPAGSSLPHNNMPPYLAMRYCIALQGVFPSRN
ncbi:phage tail protein [Erythrobacter arachoides]|uniref:Phage tail protein n=1 Tax=Aurantiacibacter arachoides TaxID=1850444 RepID=A0A845A5N3_9SPHN|nr:tail fiber protein [Aurantiacibacter arachoides]MXO92869.1 phage tail protein [Aurantiacibacter arachoides]GGD53830.1 tail Collar domain-containing protein [Aurantiacibacter arachoides]